MADLIITIDGPAASGKSTVAKLLAEKLGASFLDTGAMYRAVTLAAIEAGVDIRNEEKLLEIMQITDFQFSVKENKSAGCLTAMAVYIDGVDVTEQIRQPQITANSRYIASSAKLRERLVEMQRQFAAGQKRIVTEGRDQGTVAFPDADIKFYLMADLSERAKRRQAELQAKGLDVNLEQIQWTIEERDKSDENRAVGPLKPAPDAIVIDTTDLSVEQVVEKILRCVQDRRQKSEDRRCKTECLSSVICHLISVAWYWLSRWACRVFCILFFRIRVYGRENVPEEGAFILAGNHQSYLDPVLCGVALKQHLCFLARDSLYRNRFFALLIYSLNAVPVKLDSADVSSMKKIISKLKEGRGVCLYPEATRTSDGRIKPFKSGFGLLCRRGQAAVVPVLIDGAFECWPRHKRIFTPGPVSVYYGKAISAEQAQSMGDEKLAELLTSTLRQMQNNCLIRKGKKPFYY